MTEQELVSALETKGCAGITVQHAFVGSRSAVAVAYRQNGEWRRHAVIGTGGSAFEKLAEWSGVK